MRTEASAGTISRGHGQLGLASWRFDCATRTLEIGDDLAAVIGAPGGAGSAEIRGVGKVVLDVDETSVTVDADQSERYADASGDRNPIHLDAAFAKQVGLPDRILHGLCTMAMTSATLVEQGLGGDPSRLKRLKVRFSKPVLMGDTLTTTVWELGKEDRNVRWGFEVTNQRGDVVISGGEADVLD